MIEDIINKNSFPIIKTLLPFKCFILEFYCMFSSVKYQNIRKVCAIERRFIHKVHRLSSLAPPKHNSKICHS